VSFVTMATMISGAASRSRRVFLLVLSGWTTAVGPLAARVRAAGMPAAPVAFQTPVEVP
jgi:hypothetical protein